MKSEASLFRDAMRRMAATVCVVTTFSDGKPLGMTATAVSSLAAEPASLLVCVNQSASMHDSLATASHFCVNVLQAKQVAIAQTFSNSKLKDVRFAGGEWEISPDQPPLLRGAQVCLVCERTQLVAFATHTICIGTVTSIRLGDSIEPLLYLDGKFVNVGMPVA